MFAVVMVKAVGSSVFGSTITWILYPYTYSFLMWSQPHAASGSSRFAGRMEPSWTMVEMLRNSLVMSCWTIWLNRCSKVSMSDAFDEMTVVSDIRVIFESKLSSPEVVFF